MASQAWIVTSDSATPGVAQDADVVHDTGDEAIAGVKTFTSAPVVPDASFAIAKSTGLQSALDVKAAATDNVAGDQTILNVVKLTQVAYGALGTKVHDALRHHGRSLRRGTADPSALYVGGSTVSDDITGLSDGDLVGTWPDSSGNGRYSTRRTRRSGRCSARHRHQRPESCRVRWRGRPARLCGIQVSTSALHGGRSGPDRSGPRTTTASGVQRQGRRSSKTHARGGNNYDIYWAGGTTRTNAQRHCRHEPLSAADSVRRGDLVHTEGPGVTLSSLDLVPTVAPPTSSAQPHRRFVT
ncbi:hypothetical protein [Salinilacustrithrix flava]|uniref:hypothetical protein n=1 Tax=Salinilacustrithrix flava TaxID=2957203 RepID=UPI003D7C285F